MSPERTEVPDCRGGGEAPAAEAAGWAARAGDEMENVAEFQKLSSHGQSKVRNHINRGES